MDSRKKKLNMKEHKLSDSELERREAKRDVWREVLDGIDEIKAGGGKRSVETHLHGLTNERLNE